jgi:hypothetical protein
MYIRPFLFVLPCMALLVLALAACSPKSKESTGNTPGFDSTKTWDQEADFADGLIRVKKGNQYGFINRQREVVIPPKWNLAFDFRGGYAIVREGQKYGHIDKKGLLVVPCKYDQCGNFYEGKAAVRAGDLWGFVDVNGKEIILPQWGYIDSTGAMIIKAQLDDAWPFRQGLAHCFKGGLWGYIDPKGKTMIPFNYLNAGEFEGTTAPAQRRDGSWIQIDRTGRCVAFCDEKGDLSPGQSGVQGRDAGHGHSEHDGHTH